MNPEGLPPDAVEDQVVTSRTKPVIIPVLINDLIVQNTTQLPTSVNRIIVIPSFGTAVLNDDGTITYTPSPNTSASTDTFVYQICNESACDVALVTIKLTGEVLGASDRAELARTGGV